MTKHPTILIGILGALAAWASFSALDESSTAPLAPEPSPSGSVVTTAEEASLLDALGGPAADRIALEQVDSSAPAAAPIQLASDQQAPVELEVFASDGGQALTTIYMTQRTSANQTFPTHGEADRKLVLEGEAAQRIPGHWRGKELWIGAPGRAWAPLAPAQSKTVAFLDPEALLRFSVPAPKTEHWKWYLDLVRHSPDGLLTDREDHLELSASSAGIFELYGLHSGHVSLTLSGGNSKLRSNPVADGQEDIHSGSETEVEWFLRPEESLSTGGFLANYRGETLRRAGLRLAVTRDFDSGARVTNRYSHRAARPHLDGLGLEWNVQDLPVGDYHVELLPGMGKQLVEIKAGQVAQIDFGQALNAELEILLRPSSQAGEELNVFTLMARRAGEGAPWVNLPDLQWAPSESSYRTVSRLSPGNYEFRLRAQGMASIARVIPVTEGTNVAAFDLIAQPGCVLELESLASLKGEAAPAWHNLVIRNSAGLLETPVLVTRSATPSKVEVYLDLPGTYVVQVSEDHPQKTTVTLTANERQTVVL